MLRTMILVGLTGGVATGKSTVAKMFKQCGAVGDRCRPAGATGRRSQVNRPGEPSSNYSARQSSTLTASLNRQALGSIVFRNPAKRRHSNASSTPASPASKQRLTRQDRQAKDPNAVVIYEVPLLFEAGVDKRVDKTIVVTADRETQIARLKKRNGLSRAEALRRIRSQMPLAKKIRQADHVLNGTLPRPSLRKQVGQLFKSLRLLA